MRGGGRPGQRGGSPWMKIENIMWMGFVFASFMGGMSFSDLSKGSRCAKLEGLMAKDSEALQAQVNQMRESLETLTRENQELVRQQARKDVKECASKLQAMRQDMDLYKQRAKQVDDAREEFYDVNQDLEAEKKRSFEMELKAKTLGDKLEKNRKALEEIERQRSEAENRYGDSGKTIESSSNTFKQHMADSQLAATGHGAKAASEAKLQSEVLSTLARMRGVGAMGDVARKLVKAGAQKAAEAGAGGVGGAGESGMVKERLREVHKLISNMNLDLSAKSQTIAELAEQKREAEKSVRRLESKLIEAGVSPDQLEKVKEGGPELKKEFNPAMAAASQVVGGAGKFVTSQDILNGKVHVIFGKIDENGDQTIDFAEFKKALHHSGANSVMESKLAKSKFDTIDRDRTGYVTLEEAYMAGSKFLPMFEGMEVGTPQNWVQSPEGGSGDDDGVGAGNAAGDKGPMNAGSAARIASKRSGGGY